jgi:hypothetical protein
MNAIWKTITMNVLFRLDVASSLYCDDDQIPSLQCLFFSSMKSLFGFCCRFLFAVGFDSFSSYGLSGLLIDASWSRSVSNDVFRNVKRAPTSSARSDIPTSVRRPRHSVIGVIPTSFVSSSLFQLTII